MNLLRKKLMATVVATTTTLTSFSSSIQAEETSLMEAIKNGKSSLSFRLRVEDVELKPENAESRDATATTLLTRLNYGTADYNGFSGFIEFDQVSELFKVDYNTWGGDIQFPNAAVVADPEGTDLNQVYLQYKVDTSTVRYGRQRIVFDDQRHVGGVAWRQNEQTYDSSSYAGVFGKLKVFGAYVYGVNRIFGDQSPAGDHDNATMLLHANYNFSEAASLTGYKYVLDNKNIARQSSDTTGVRLTGKAKAFAYTAEYATQSDNADNPVDYTADFLALEGSAMIKPIKITLGHQLLGADGDGFFVTPLATLHKFQGWADVFLNGGLGNLPGGIEDTYVSVGSKIGPAQAAVIYHTFSTDDAGVAGFDDYGSEIDFIVKGKAGPFNLMLKYANFSSDQPDRFADRTITWLMAGIKF